MKLPDRLLVVRPDDLVVLTIRFHNLELDSSNRLVQSPGSSSPPLVILEFPPQSLLEAAFQVLDPPSASDPLAHVGGVRAAFSNPSRLVFDVSATPSIDLTLEDILTAVDDEIAASSDGKTTGDTSFFDAFPLTSAVELPYGLVLRADPKNPTGWRHDRTPRRGLAGRTGLWHTRLARAREHFGAVDVRAIWSDERPEPFGPLTLRATQRADLAAYGLQPDLPPIRADRLMLSCLGGWLDAEADFRDFNTGRSLTYWRHRMTLGRDHYVKTIDLGYLMPFGHPAAKVTISERKLGRAAPSEPIAGYIRRQEFLMVRVAGMTYPAHRGFPFASVTLKTLVTPKLRPSEESPLGGQHGFWPRVGSKEQPADFQFQITAFDITGHRLEFSAPLAFVARAGVDSLDSALLEFADPKNDARRRRLMLGQFVTYAPFGGGESPALASTYETDVIDFGAQGADGADRPTPVVSPEVPDERPPFRPLIQRAVARVPAIRELTGNPSPVAFAYHPAYTAEREQPLDVFATLVDDPLRPWSLGRPGMSFSAEQAGGLVAPTVPLSSLSTSHGALGKTAGDGSLEAPGPPPPPGQGPPLFDPASYFEGAPRLLGAIALADILAAVTSPPDGDESPIPKVVTRKENGTTITTFEWKTVKFRDDAPVDCPFKAEEGAAFTIHVTRTVPATGPPIVMATGVLTNFALMLLPAVQLVRLPFKSVSFTAVTGKKVDVSVELGGAPEFLGQLAFVQQVIDALPLQGFSDPPSLNVTPEGVDLGYSLGIPTVGLGYVTMQNLALAAGFHLPLGSGSAALTFSFSERHNPFIVTYSALGGGGFFSIAVSLKGVEMLEASVEFGGAFALNLGIASGAANLTVGIYYGLLDVNGTKEYRLSGFVRAAGKLEVLGIISVSAEFYLQLLYLPDTNVVRGSATLTVKVKVLFFSKSVELTVEREFPGPPKLTTQGGAQPAPLFAPSPGASVIAAAGIAGPARPAAAASGAARTSGLGEYSFATSMSREAWLGYCNAFAAD